MSAIDLQNAEEQSPIEIKQAVLLNEEICCFHLVAPHISRDVLEFIEPIVVNLGYELIRIRITGEENGGSVLQIMIDHENGISAEDCGLVSRDVSVMLDVEDPIKENYVLEVSSPGFARPLTRPIDFVNWQGYEAKIELNHAVDGQKRFRGILDGFVDGEVRVELKIKGYDEPQVLGLRFQDISMARLVDSKAKK